MSSEKKAHLFGTVQGLSPTLVPLPRGILHTDLITLNAWPYSVRHIVFSFVSYTQLSATLVSRPTTAHFTAGAITVAAPIVAEEAGERPVYRLMLYKSTFWPLVVLLSIHYEIN